MALTFDELKKAQTQPGFNLVEAAKAASLPYTPPNPSTPIPVANLATNTNFPNSYPNSNLSSFVGGIDNSQKYFQDLYNKQTTESEAVKKEREDFKKILGQSYDQHETLPNFYKEQEQSLGIPEQYKNLNEINLQIADLTSAYDKEFGRVETKGIQSGTPAIFYQGEQAAIQRQKAVEIGALSVRQAAMAGNLDLANQRAAKLTEFQFKPIENRINKTLKFLDLNYQDMTAAERRQADTLSQGLKFQVAAIEQQKENYQLGLTSGVSQPYFMKVGDPTVYRTSDGYAFTSEQDFISKGGNWSKIQSINPAENKQNKARSPGLEDKNFINKPVNISDRQKYYLPITVTQGELTNVKTAIKAVIQQSGGVNNENRYYLWEAVAKALEDANLNPTDYAAILWEAFDPEGLQGYKNMYHPINKKTNNNSSSQSFEDKINALLGQ